MNEERWEYKILMNMLWQVLPSWKQMEQDIYTSRLIVMSRMRPDDKFDLWMDDNIAMVLA